MATSAKTISTNVLQVRMRFTLANQFLGPLGSIIQSGFARKAQQHRKARIIPRNLALAHLIKHAIKGVYPDLFVNPSEVLLSDGPLVSVDQVRIHRQDHTVVAIFNGGQVDALNHDDEVILVAYAAGAAVACRSTDKALRSSGRVQLHIPPGLEQQILHVYILVCDRSAMYYARSRYLGSLSEDGAVVLSS